MKFRLWKSTLYSHAITASPLFIRGRVIKEECPSGFLSTATWCVFSTATSRLTWTTLCSALMRLSTSWRRKTSTSLTPHTSGTTSQCSIAEALETLTITHSWNTCRVISPSLSHRVVFWFGDLNFRIADHGLHFLRSSINGGRLHLLWNKDQVI